MHSKRLSLITIIFLFCCFTLEAQTVLLSVDRGTDSIPVQRGPNLKKISHVLFNFGFIAGADKPESPIIYGTSIEYGFGVRKKYKISPVYSLGWELIANGKIFKIKQQNGKTFPDTTLNDVERLDYYILNIGFYNRFNFDPGRGNFMGTFLDLGVKGGWNFQTTYVIKNDLPGGSKIKSEISGLPYVNHFNYDVFTRIGRSHISLYASYRLSKLFKPEYAYPELPSLTFGIEAAIF